MKKQLFILITSFFFLSNYAQNEFLDYAVTNNRDTIYGKINYNTSKLIDVTGIKHKISVEKMPVLRKNDMMFYTNISLLNSKYKKGKKDSVYVFKSINSGDADSRIIFRKKTISYVNRQKRMKDFIITFENDTIYGEINKNLNYRARLKNKLGKKIIISTKVVKMYRWNNNYYYNKKKAAVMIGDRKKTFLKLLLDGKIKLFEYEIVGGGFALANSGGNNSFSHNNDFETELYYFLEVDGELKIVQKHRFLKNMIKILKNDSDLIKRLKKREFDYSNMYLLVKEYNAKN